MTSFARAERTRLCDLALEAGPDAPTLAGDWNVRELLAHLVVREQSPLGAPGIVISPLAGLTDRQVARHARRPLPDLVARVRKPLSPLALPGVDQAVNTIEFFVHHEDIRRAAPSWEPRTLTRAENDALWRAIRISGRGLVRPAGVPVVIRRSDTGAQSTLRGGDDPVILGGMPSEIVLFLYGRRQTRDLTFEGPDKRVERLRRARLGL